MACVIELRGSIDPGEVIVIYPDGTQIVVPEDNPHTCIVNEGTDAHNGYRRCLACEGEYLTLTAFYAVFRGR